MSDNMKPGPDLDRLVAEKVMGWKASHHGNYWLNAESRSVYRTWTPSIEGWNPSTNIAHAWEVVRQVISMSTEPGRHSDFNLRAPSDKGGHNWAASFRPWLDTLEEYSDGITAPHAICLAALAAVGYKPE